MASRFLFFPLEPGVPLGLADRSKRERRSRERRFLIPQVAERERERERPICERRSAAEQGRSVGPERLRRAERLNV